MSTDQQRITVRPYQESDYPFIKAILQEENLFRESVDSRQMLKKVIKENPGSILVSCEGQEVIGTVSFETGRVPLIFRLAVTSSRRHQGVGTILMQEAERELRQRGYNDVHLLVEEENSELHEFYRKLGYDKHNLYRWFHKEF